VHDWFGNWRGATDLRVLFIGSYLRQLLATNFVEGLPHVGLVARRVPE
jgi:hypothetical protein